MDEEQKERSKQYSSNIGTIEILRLGCAVMIWIFIGMGVSFVFYLAGYSNSSIIFAIFLVMLFVFTFISRSRKPTYLLLRRILGNKNLPAEPMPRSTVKIHFKPRPWWGYLSGFWNWVLFLLLLYAVIRYLSK